MKSFIKYFIVIFVFIHFGLIHSVNGLTCTKCNSDTSKDCIASPDKLTGDDNLAKECTDSCFTKILDSKVSRGCSSEAECPSANESCTLCKDKDNCNNDNMLSCYNCTSENNNKKCAVFDSSIKSTKCEKDSTSCVMRINDNKTIRSCSTSEIEKDCSGDTCKTCKDVNCNNDALFPANRIKCYQCNVDTENCDNPEKLTEDVCDSYVQNDGCYQYSPTDNDGKMKRGCVSDADYKSCSDAKERCVKCSESKCNNLLYNLDATRKCISCNSTNNANCHLETDTAKAAKCTKQRKYYETEQCYTQILQKSPVQIDRGCNLDSEKSIDCNTEDATCCGTDACNAGIIFSCIRCRSDYTNGDKCKNSPKDLKGSFCVNTPTNSKDTLCYSRKVDSKTFRGCLVDLNQNEQDKCLDTKYTSCSTCNETNCNTDLLKGGANNMKIYVWLTLLSSLILFLVK